MNLTQLNYFREVVEKGSFTGAANALFISQSTLSKSIRALEDEYKVILINRGAKEFDVTEEGRSSMSMRFESWIIMNNRQKSWQSD